MAVMVTQQRRSRKARRPQYAAVVAVAAAAVLGSVLVARSGAAPNGQRTPAQMSYPYESDSFRALVAESYQVTKGEDAAQFYQWLEKAFAAKPATFHGTQAETLPALLDEQRRLLDGAPDAARRTKRELSVASGFHAMVKALIPRFSLERGFEFAYAVKLGERQCLLQSALLAALLQQVGVNAGIVMIHHGSKGDGSNISHVATLVKLSDGTDTLLDASYQEPFVKHAGLLVDSPSYRFVQPRYAAKSARITSYRDEGTGRAIPAAAVAPLDYGFLRSQFWYYRGERAPGGVFSSHPTRKGLAASRQSLEKSVAFCPGNPIAVYMLGRDYRALGDRSKAAQLLTKARDLYAKYGWLPAGPAQAAASVRKAR